MLHSRSDAMSGSAPAYVLFVLIFSVVSCFFSVHDAHASGPPKLSTIPHLDIKSVEKSMIDFQLRGLVQRSGLDSSSRRSGDTLMGPIGREAPFGTWASFEPARKVKPLPQAPSSGRESPGSRGLVHPIVDRPFGKPAPLKPLLTGGANYRFGREERTGGLLMDFFLPARLSGSSSVFLESRSEYQRSLAKFPPSPDRRFDLGLGLGWRKVWDGGVMIGTNAFLDASRLDGDWYSAPGFGIEFASHSRDRVWDAILNVYRGGGIDLKVGRTFPVLEDRLDMRLYVEKYRFFDGEFILGHKGGVELSSPNRFVTISYAYGQDSRDPEYHAVSCSLAIPFSLDKILSGKNPIEIPDPSGRETRYSERLKSEGVKRARRIPDTVVEARRTPQGRRWTTPGKLSDSMFWASKPSKSETQTAKTEKADTTAAHKSKDCCSEKTEKVDKKTSSGPGLLDLLLGGPKGSCVVLGTICLAGATYLGGDYTYRNAFGPFELEPHELDRIKQEMPKSRRKK
jgi:hypothetical protein